MKDYRQVLKGTEYNFLRENKHLGKSIGLLVIGGSHCRGMATENSDLDVRGFAYNTARNIALGRDFEQVFDQSTDTMVYSFDKIVRLLSASNPGLLELLGCPDECYLYADDVAKELIANRKMFLSQCCVATFAGYASSQLRRLENKAASIASQSKKEEHILNSLRNGRYMIESHYTSLGDGGLSLYTDSTTRGGLEQEVYMDIDLKHYPLRDWVGLWNELKSIVTSYDKNSRRNERAISHDKLGKHMAILLHLYMECIDILEKEDIIPYRVAEHDLLMSIRHGDYLTDSMRPRSDFYDLVNEYDKKLEYAKLHTNLPKSPDKEAIDEFRLHVNRQIVKGE